MTDQNWAPLGGVAADRLTPSRVMAHHAAQWVTRAARAALDPLPDDSQSNLGWEPDHDALMSHRLAADSGSSRLGLRLPDLTLILVGSSGVTDSFPLNGKTDAEAGAWTDEILATQGRPGSASQTALPYAMPEHEVADGAVYDVETHRAALAELANWFANGDLALEQVRSDLASVSPGPSPVRCWPHHFDIATFVSLEEGDPEAARAIGIGLSPGDETYDQPYLYVNPWPQLAPDGLPPLDAPGRWHTDGFVGAIATGTDILALTDQMNGVAGFLRQAIALGRDRLGL